MLSLRLIYRGGKMKRAIVLFIVGFVVLSVITLFSLTGAISRYAVKTLFEPQQLTLSEKTHVSYDPFENSLKITDFALLHEQAKTLLSMEKLLVEFDLIPLFNNHIKVNRFELTGLSTAISQDQANPGAWKLNGWSTANLASSTEEIQVKQQATSEPQPLKISVNNLQLSDINVTAELPKHSHKVLLNSLSLLNFELQLDALKQPQSMGFELTADLQTQNTISRAETIFDNNNQVTEPLPLSFGADLELSLQPEVEFTEQVIQIKNEQTIDINLANVKLNDASSDLAISLGNLLLGIKALELTTPVNESASTKLTAELSTNLEQLLVNNNDKTVELVNLESAALLPAQIMFEQGPSQATPIYNLTTKEFRLDQLTVMKHLDENKPTLSTLEKLVMSNLVASDSAIGVDLIQVGKSTNNLLINDTKQLANLYIPGAQLNTPETKNEQTADQADKSKPSEQPQPVTEAKPESAPENASENSTKNTPEATMPAFGLRINEMANVGPISVNTVDMSVSPIYRSLIEISHIGLQNLDSEKPDQTTTFNLNATNNKYAKINVSSQSKPFTQDPSHDVQVTLDEVDLSAISPYISGALGYHINSGQLDSNITAKVKNEKIDGNADLLIRSIDLTAISNQGEESSISTGAISFNYALSMLKDGDGNVDLSVPFSGDLNNPSVGFSGFMSLIVKRATMAAAKDYLINTFVPYANVVSFALSASKHILKLRFNDLAFDAKQVNLTKSQQDIIEQLALVLEKHDSVSIKLCPISTVSDLELASDAEAPTAKTINTSQVSHLLDLAQTRADNVKQALVDTGKVTSKRLLFCSPTIRYGQSDTPRITFDQLN